MEEELDSFKCSGCGLCCKAIQCPHLQADNKCSIYETRPDICNVDKGYDKHFKNYMSKTVWYALNYQACEALQKQENTK